MRIKFAVSLLVLISAVGCSSRDSATEPTDRPTGLATKSMVAGEVSVNIDPVRIDEDGAVFEITLDTHTVELDMDLARDASLTVGGTEWGNATWDGDPPSGHHREGTLTFEPDGRARGVARLVLGGFPELVEAEWRFGTGG